MRTTSFRMKHAVMFAFAAAALLALAGALPAAEEAAKTEKAAAEDTYPLSTCIVTGAELGSAGSAVPIDRVWIRAAISAATRVPAVVVMSSPSLAWRSYLCLPASAGSRG